MQQRDVLGRVRARGWHLLLVAVAVLATSTLVAETPAQADARTARERTIESHLFAHHNTARHDPRAFGHTASGSRDQLLWAEDLAEVARAWSDELASSGVLRHNPSYASQSTAWRAIAENVAWVTTSGRSDAAVAQHLAGAWMDSASHRSTILERRYAHVGIGVSAATNGRVYATAVFRDPQPGAPAGSTDYPTTPAGYPATSTPPEQCAALVGDWDGSGRDGIGWWCDGRTRLRTASGIMHTFVYGRSGDVPIVADWDGDGRDTVSVIRDGEWHLNNKLTGGTAERTFTYGRVTRGDVPIAGDWRANGKAVPGIIRDGEWHLRFAQSGGNADHLYVYGRLTAGDLALWGDWNGDGRDTPGIVRGGTWHLRNSPSGGSADLAYTYGAVLDGDVPVTGDWDGDGRDTPGIVRGATWHLKDAHGGGQHDRAITFRTP